MIELYVHFKRIRKKKKGVVSFCSEVCFVEDCHMSVVSIFLGFFFFGIGKGLYSFLYIRVVIIKILLPTCIAYTVNKKG